MATSLIPDPLQMWRDAVTKFENDVNAALTGSTKSQEVMNALQQFSGITLGMQQMFEKAVSAHLRRINLPSRKEVTELAESLQRIEDKLDRLLPTTAFESLAPRPARTRRPPGAAAAAAPPAAVPAAARKAAPSKRRRATRAKEG